MGCDCNKSKSGDTIVWQWLDPVGGTKTYATQADAGIARDRAGGQGPIIRTTQTAK